MTNVFIESSDFDLGDGEQFTFIRRIIPDFKFLQDNNAGNINIVVKIRDFPGESLSTSSTSAISASTKQAFVRARARQMVLRFESDDDASNNKNLDIGWRLGATRIDTRPDGKR